MKVITESKDGLSWITQMVERRELGKRCRKKFKERHEAEGFAASKRVESAKQTSLHFVTTRLTEDQVAEAESAFNRLGDRYTLDGAVSYLLSHSAEPDKPTIHMGALYKFLDGKKADGVGKRSILQSESTLRSFERFATPRRGGACSRGGWQNRGGVPHVSEKARRKDAGQP